MKKITFSEHSYFIDLISDEPILIDLGACLGSFSKHFRSQYKNSKIILMEPSKSNFPKIEIDDENTKKIFGAISSKKEKLIFREDPRSEQNGSLLFDYFEGVEYEVETYTLDELIEPFETVDLLKMDVEGAEWDVLLNCSDETLNKIKQLTVEFHDFLDPSLRERSELCVERLISLGFSIDYNPTTYMHGSKYYDSLFYKK
jgi:FkbM family methyltransferase